MSAFGVRSSYRSLEPCIPFWVLVKSRPRSLGQGPDQQNWANCHKISLQTVVWRRVRIADGRESACSPTSHCSVLLDLSSFLAEHCRNVWSLCEEWTVGFGWELRNCFVVFLCIFESAVVPISSFLVIAYWQAAIKQDVTMALHFHFGSSSLGTAYCFVLPIEKTVFHRRNLKKITHKYFCDIFPGEAPVNTHFCGNTCANHDCLGGIASSRTSVVKELVSLWLSWIWGVPFSERCLLYSPGMKILRLSCLF